MRVSDKWQWMSGSGWVAVVWQWQWMSGSLMRVSDDHTKITKFTKKKKSQISPKMP
jgi:hypothetical protein